MEITKKSVLVDTAGMRITRMELRAPEIAKKALPGQFVMVMARAEGERIPLTIVESDRVRGTITLIFQEVGLTTKLLGSLDIGGHVFAIVGPLGNPSHIMRYGHVAVVGGGVGTAEIYPVVKALKEAGNTVSVIIGARTRALLILEDELRVAASDLCVATDDGSAGEKGFVTDMLGKIISKDKVDLVYAVGPIPMMKAVCSMTAQSGIPTVVSLNALMVDATGMCGCCRVTVGGKVKFSCVDGPEFDGNMVDWDEMTKRNAIYRNKELHVCKLGKI